MSKGLKKRETARDQRVLNFLCQNSYVLLCLCVCDVDSLEFELVLYMSFLISEFETSNFGFGFELILEV